MKTHLGSISCLLNQTLNRTPNHPLFFPMPSSSLHLTITTRHQHTEQPLDLHSYVQQFDMEDPVHRSHASTAIVRSIEACSRSRSKLRVQQVHDQVKELGFESDVYVANALISAYVKCGSLTLGRGVFDGLIDRNVVSWTAMIAGYVKHEKPAEALGLFQEMKGRGFEPNCVTFTCVVNACARVCALEVGRAVHEEVVARGLQRNLSVSNALVDMYVKCSDLTRARWVFDDMHFRNVVSWTSMIAGYAKQNSAHESLELFREMRVQGVNPNERTYVAVLNACARLDMLDQGMLFHEEIAAAGFQSNIFLANALIDMYGKCGSISHARRVFDAMPIRDVVSWTAMIKGYSSHGNCEGALELFYKMKQEGLTPDRVTFVCVLNLCAKLTARDMGKQVHADILEAGVGSNVFVGNALVDFYAKCGDLQAAEEVFRSISSRNVISWTAMIAGYASHRRREEAFQLFWQMQRENIKPDEATFGSILSLCSHLGLVEEALKIFNIMVEKFRIAPNLKHYGCMIDLFGRSGDLPEAITMIKRMPRPPGTVQWTALLAACRLHGNLELAEYVMEHIVKSQPQGPASFSRLGNMYAQSCRQVEAVS